MQDFVEKYVKEQEEARSARISERTAEMEKEQESARDARLIRLGMCEKVYSESNVYSDEFPYEEFKTGKHYKLVPFTVTDEEYALICRYDSAPVDRKKRSLTARTFGNTARRIRRTSILRLIFGLVASAFLAVILYLMDSEFLPFSFVVFALGAASACFDALAYYATGETLSAVEYLVDEADRRPGEERE